MSIMVNLKNVKISGQARVLNNATVSTPDTISLDTVTIDGKAVVLENLNITEFCRELQANSDRMQPDERKNIQEMLNAQNNSKHTFWKLLQQHLISFSEGVAASIVANCIWP